MSRLILVRHGEPTAGWGDPERDPGLTDRGRAQAVAMADALASTGPLPVVVSPLRRTRETAAALESRWSVTARVDPAVGEVPAPDEGDRVEWLSRLLVTSMDDWPADVQAWRRSVIDTLHGLPDNTVVVTHFVAIVAATGLPDLRPDYCSRTDLVVP